MAKKKLKERDKLRLVNWWNDGFPPIDLNEHTSHVRELIAEVLALRNRIKELGNQP